MSVAEIVDLDPRYANDEALLERALEPYLDHCRYLKSGTVRQAGSFLAIDCFFSIIESCYIRDTGHFNSVEFNICYNQMFYYLIAKAVDKQLLEPFSRWSIEEYWDRQLPNILIAQFESRFRKGMRGRFFQGSLRIDDIIVREGHEGRQALIVIPTSCRYWDDEGGTCNGAVKIAITNPPLRIQ